MARVENHNVEKTQLRGVDVRIVSYQIGDKFHCHVENVDPGATISRAEGSTRDEAMKIAVEKASGRIK